MFNIPKTLFGLAIAIFLGLGTASAQDAPPAAQTLPRLMRQLGSAVPTQKVQAAGALAKLGSSGGAATDLLLACLDDTDPDVRLYCAYALAEVTNDVPRTLKALTPVLNDKNEHVRYSAEWSIAKIARSINAQTPLTPTQLDSIRTSLESTLSKFSKQEHQPRHATAVRSALETLATRSATIASTNNQLKAELEMKAKREAIIAIFAKQFHVGDRVQRLQLIEEVRAEHLDDAEITNEAMHCVLATGDYVLLEFAISRWGEAGRVCAKNILLAVEDDKLPSWTTTLLSQVESSDRQLFERLLGIALNRRLPTEVRSAALSALGKSPVDRNRAQASLSNIVFDRAELDELRLAAAQSLAELGELPTAMHDSVFAIMKRPEESATLKQELTYQLHKLTPNSTAAVQTLTDLLTSTDVNDASYVDFARAIGGFKTMGTPALRPLLAGLQSTEEYVRATCAAAIGELGEPAAAAIPSLIAIIVDSEVTVSTKSEVALVLKKLGPRAVEPLAEKLNSANPLVREHVLRTLAIIGPSASSTTPFCASRLSDPQEDLSVRCAAATAIGAFGPAAANAASALSQATTADEDTQLRIAALLSLAQVQAAAAAPRIAEFAGSDEHELRVAAGFAKHLAGSTTEAFQALVDLSEHQENTLVEDTLLDMGKVIMPLLLRTIRDQNATDESRITCARVYAQLHPNDWSAVLEGLGNDRLGQGFYEAVLAGWEFDENLLPQLMVALRSERTSTSAKAHMLQIANYITSELGAGGDEDEWTGSFAIMRHVQNERDLAPTTSSAIAMEEIATTPEPMLPAEQAPFIPDAQRAAPVAPKPTGNDRLVKVYYGTNRQPAASSTASNIPSSGNSMGYAAALGLTIAAMATCCFGFLRRKSPAYTLAAITGLAGATTIAVQTIRYSRAPALTQNENVEYGSQLSKKVEMGICEVSIPESHKPGELESPSMLLRLEVVEDPEKHIVLKSVKRLSPDDYFADMHRELDAKGSNVLVFIHGYNVSFKDAARRTAQMAYDLKFPGVPVFYSWPSQANWYGYRNDSQNIQNSVDQIQTFLSEIAARSNAKSINLVAHSMGNVGLTAALARMDSAKFNQIVLAAPDIDAEIFKHEIAPRILTRADRVTLYTSKTDLALIASKYFNHGPRAGDSGSDLVLVPGIQTIDATAVDSSLLGHSYYGSNINVLYDLGQLLSGKSIEARDYLRPNPDPNRPYWYFSATAEVPQQLAIPKVPLRR